MAAELGPDYLPFVLDVLQSALPMRGYTAHVLGFTLHSVLAGVVKVSLILQGPAQLLSSSLFLHESNRIRGGTCRNEAIRQLYDVAQSQA